MVTIMMFPSHFAQPLAMMTGPISSLLVLPRSPMLPHGSMTDQQGRSASRRAPTLPVAPLSKYVASDTLTQDPNPWEGPLVILPSSYPEDEDLEGHSYSSAAMERQIRELEVHVWFFFPRITYVNLSFSSSEFRSISQVYVDILITLDHITNEKLSSAKVLNTEALEYPHIRS